jgi:hypothetical protein
MFNQPLLKNQLIILPSGRTIKLHKENRADRFAARAAYNRLPFYKKIFTKKPKGIFNV